MNADDSLDIRLIKTGIDLFGRDGFAATSTRAIAREAGAQMSAITYHFGGKEGLYLACARYIAQEMKKRLAPAVGASEAALGDDLSPTAARQACLALIGGGVTVMMQDDVALIARFVVREQMNPTPAFNILYEGVMADMTARAAMLLRRISPTPMSDEEVSVRTVAMMGQVFAFRFARAVLMETTGWKSTGDRETNIVRAIVLDHTNATLAALERGGPHEP